MGRQGYLIRLAFGRSAFETPDHAALQYPHDAVGQQLDPQSSGEPTQPPVNSGYIQSYDDRGHPINHRSRDLGRALRESQNDVLAAIGVVEVVDRRPSPSPEQLQKLTETAHKLDGLETEDTVGDTIALLFAVVEQACGWWAACLRDRLLTFRTSDSISFAELVDFECRSTNALAFFFAGFPAHFLAAFTVHAWIYATLALRPIDRILLWMRSSRKSINLYRRWRGVLSHGFRFGVELACYPILHHGILQRLGLIPARPFLPSLSTLVPLTASSPVRGILFPSDLGSTESVSFAQTILGSPVFFVCLEQFVDRWVYSMIYEAIETSSIRPDRPDIANLDDGLRRRAIAILGLCEETPSVLKNVIYKLMDFLRWGRPTQSTVRARRGRERGYSAGRQAHAIQVDEHTISDVRLLDLPTSHLEVHPIPSTEEAQDIHELRENGSSAFEFQTFDLPSSPVSLTVSEASQNMLDPSVRITSRDVAEGIVELEVRLPNVVATPTSADIASTDFPNYGVRQHVPAFPPRARPRMTHRVSQLSLEPSQMLGTIIKSHVVRCISLPIRVIGLRLIASRFLVQHPEQGWRAVLLSPFPFVLQGDAYQMRSWRSMALLVSKRILCGAIEIVIDFSIWGCQLVVVTWVGRKFFDWGKL